MTDWERLSELLSHEGEWDGRFGKTAKGEDIGAGRVPTHYKRCSIPRKRRDYLAWLGLTEMVASYADTTLFYTQALIAGAVLSGDYDQVTVVTSSQYGKTWLLGRLALRMAFDGHAVNVGGSTEPLTDKIMRQSMVAASKAVKEIKKALTAETLRKVDRLDQSISKTRLSFPGRGHVQGLSLGDTFDDIDRNKAVGESGAWIIDEAALISTRAMSELGRREFSSIDGTVEPLIMISNPHKPGYFYDALTKDPLDERECVIWADALTMAQEGRRTAKQILKSDFAKNRDTLQRYLLCELPTTGAGMIEEPVVLPESPATPQETVISVLGIDAAYKGKDNIEVCHAQLTSKGVYVTAVETIEKSTWIDGVTTVDIIDQIARTYHALGCAMCCVDIGFGVWLLEGLIHRGVMVHGVNFGAGATKWRVRENVYAAVNAQNLRAEMHLDMQDMVDRKTFMVSPQVWERIRETLPLIMSERRRNGKVIVSPKAEIKARLGHSPDAFDAVLLALHAVITYTGEGVGYITEDTVEV